MFFWDTKVIFAVYSVNRVCVPLHQTSALSEITHTHTDTDRFVYLRATWLYSHCGEVFFPLRARGIPELKRNYSYIWRHQAVKQFRLARVTNWAQFTCIIVQKLTSLFRPLSICLFVCLSRSFVFLPLINSSYCIEALIHSSLPSSTAAIFLSSFIHFFYRFSTYFSFCSYQRVFYRYSFN